jgi:hypothetical protein
LAALTRCFVGWLACHAQRCSMGGAPSNGNGLAQSGW